MSSYLPASHKNFGLIMASSISSIGIILNTVTLVTLLKSKKLRSQATSQFVLSLTVSDLLYCSICLPMTADIYNGCSVVCDNPVLCKAYAYIFYTVATTMMFIQAAVAFNRYVALCRRENAPWKFTKRNNCLLIAFCWVFPLSALLLPLTDVWGTMGFDQELGICTFTEKNYPGSPKK